MWLTNSSIGRKVIMSVTGMALILFLTFHACMNVVALISGKGYNMICEFLGSNWYAVAATVALMALIAIHILYALILTLQNRKARGNNRYAVTNKPDKVEWSSQNMFVLGVIVLLGLILHLYNFWYNMMYAELAGNAVCPGPTNGFARIAQTFNCQTTTGIVYTILYVIWLVAIWFHLSHGFWSAIQTVGWSGNVWFKRWRIIGNVYITAVMLMFLVVVLGFATGLAPSLKCAEAPALCCGCTCTEKGEECKCQECAPLPACCQPDAKADCCKEGAECCDPNVVAPACCEKDAEKACEGCGKEEPCCQPGEACPHCGAPNGECCQKPAEEPAPEVAEEAAPEAETPAE